ncbi:MAG: zinc ribbon domain-containing protein [Chloroflexi bacterium]|nr:zinc ribbon domain-containing protein [Chloroflexota bacterium]
MPTYEYECQSCGHQFELRQGFDAESSTLCPQCKGESRRVFSPVPVIFKGSGWYVTDYAHKNSTLSGSEKRENGDKEAASASKSETTKAPAPTQQAPSPSTPSEKRASE